MKRLIINLRNDKIQEIDSKHCKYQFDSLPAYAISGSVIYIGGIIWVEHHHFRINVQTGEIIIGTSKADLLYAGADNDITLCVDYHGIRDYKLLFPDIKNENLKNKLALYYEEAEKTFENNCWLSYTLMCGAIFEGLLRNKYSKINISKIIQSSQKYVSPKYRNYQKTNADFFDYIHYSLDIKDITQVIAEIFEKTRNSRNNIHPNKDSDMVDRLSAMDIRTTMDQILLYFDYKEIQC